MLLEKQPLIFNSSFLGHDNLKHVIGQLVGEFTRQVNAQCVFSWNICLSNIEFFTRYYGIFQASIRKQKLRLTQPFIERGNVVVKIRHYVRIVRWNRQGYGWEGNRAHMHNTRKAYTNKAQVFERVCEKERCMGKPESTPNHKANEPT